MLLIVLCVDNQANKIKSSEYKFDKNHYFVSYKTIYVHIVFHVLLNCISVDQTKI